jgi:hypothetical protein
MAANTRDQFLTWWNYFKFEPRRDKWFNVFRALC